MRVAFGVKRMPNRRFAFVAVVISNRIINYEARAAAERIFRHLRPVLHCDRRRMRGRIASGLCLQGGPKAINSSPCESRECFIIRTLLRRGRDTDSLLALSHSLFLSFFPPCRKPSVKIIVIAPPYETARFLNDNTSIRYFASGYGVH